MRRHRAAAGAHRALLLAAVAAAAVIAARAPAARAWSLGGVATKVAADAKAAVEQAKGSLQQKGASPADADGADADGADAAAAAFASITLDADGSSSGGAAGTRAGPQLIKTISWEPRAWLWSNFMTIEECDHLRDMGAANLVKSDVVDSDTGAIISSQERTSSGWFLPSRNSDAVVKGLEERIARWTQVPLTHGEPFHILRYNPEEEYTAHFDIFFDQVHIQNGGQRLATVILYLSDVEEGGETVFPDSPTKPDAAQAAGFSACAKKGLGVRPRKGDALLFFSLKPDGKTHDTTSLHAGCPVVKGTKWIATKWIRVRPYHDWGDPENQATGGKPVEGEAEIKQEL